MSINKIFESINDKLKEKISLYDIKLDSDIKLTATSFCENVSLSFNIKKDSYSNTNENNLKRIKIILTKDNEGKTVLQLDLLDIKKDYDAGIEDEEEVGYIYFMKYEDENNLKFLKKVESNYNQEKIPELNKTEEEILFLVENMFYDRLELEELYNLKYDSYIYQDNTLEKIVRSLSYTKDINNILENELSNKDKKKLIAKI